MQFDYGNAESHFGADGAGTMEAIYFGSCTSWWVKSDQAKIPADWKGKPILMADLEAGMYGGNDTCACGFALLFRDRAFEYRQTC